MIKILQFGEGNFLRAFADAYFNTLNGEGNEQYEICVVKPAPFGDLEKFKAQKDAQSREDAAQAPQGKRRKEAPRYGTFDTMDAFQRALERSYGTDSEDKEENK